MQLLSRPGGTSDERSGPGWAVGPMAGDSDGAATVAERGSEADRLADLCVANYKALRGLG